MGIYSPQVLDHFHHPRNAGEIEHATAVVEAMNPICGDVLKLSVAVKEGVLAEVRFKAAGCVPALACASWLAEYLQDKPILTLAPLAPESIEQAVGGLPAASRHAAILASQALDRLLAMLAGGSPPSAVQP